jgi:serine/threonine protein kinase
MAPALYDPLAAMAEPEKKLPVGLATTQIETDDEPAARRLPTPVVVDEPDDEAPDPRVGRVLGGLYRVEELIGEGGMGKVYAARHVHINKLFAIKVLSHKIASDRQSVERLRQEAVAASSIDHDNIVNVVSFDTTDDGDVFIVMEMLKGSDLSTILEGGPLPTTRTLTIGIQICRALHAAHEAGIVHRDLKPENVFVVQKGGHDVVKILDFGISKIKTAETEKVRMTRTGQLVGTPLYMSPEQARGETDIDQRADIYAAGVILYEMVAGVPPFDGGNYFQLLWKHGNEDPMPLDERVPSAPAPLAAVVMKALAKPREARFQTMAELEQALTSVDPRLSIPNHVSLAPSAPPISRTSIPSATPSQPIAAPRPRWPMLAIAAVLVVAAIGIAVAVGSDEPRAIESTAGRDPRTMASIAADPAMIETDMVGPAMIEPERVELPIGIDPSETTSMVEGIRMSFVSDPPGAVVTLDGREIGRSPIESHAIDGDAPVTVRFALPRYRADEQTVTPADGATVRVTLRRARVDPGPSMGESPIMMSY